MHNARIHPVLRLHLFPMDAFGPRSTNGNVKYLKIREGNSDLPVMKFRRCCETIYVSLR